MEENPCCICLQDLNNDIEVLTCNHKLHKNCYKSLMKSTAQKKCPMCRVDIKYATNVCGICNQEMNLNPQSCECIISGDCGCIFHYNCMKEITEKTYCTRCDIEIYRKNFNAMSYLYFPEGHRMWIGDRLKCLHSGCNNYGIPNNYGYCHFHSIASSTNRAIVSSFAYMIKYVSSQNSTERNLIFLKSIKYMNENYKLADIEEINFESVHTAIQSLQITEIVPDVHLRKSCRCIIS